MASESAMASEDGYQRLADTDTQLNIVYQQVIGKYKQNTRFINESLANTNRTPVLSMSCVALNAYG